MRMHNVLNIVIVIVPTFSCVGRRCRICCVSLLILRFFDTSCWVFWIASFSLRQRHFCRLLHFISIEQNNCERIGSRSTGSKGTLAAEWISRAKIPVHKNPRVESAADAALSTRQTDTRPILYAFRYGRSQRNINMTTTTSVLFRMTVYCAIYILYCI